MIPDTWVVQYPVLASEVVYYFQISATSQKQTKISNEYYQSSRNRSPQLAVPPSVLRSGVVESPKPKQQAAESHASSSVRLGADDEPKQYTTTLVKQLQNFQQLVQLTKAANPLGELRSPEPIAVDAEKGMVSFFGVEATAELREGFDAGAEFFVLYLTNCKSFRFQEQLEELGRLSARLSQKSEIFLFLQNQLPGQAGGLTEEQKRAFSTVCDENNFFRAATECAGDAQGPMVFIQQKGRLALKGASLEQAEAFADELKRAERDREARDARAERYRRMCAKNQNVLSRSMK